LKPDRVGRCRLLVAGRQWSWGYCEVRSEETVDCLASLVAKAADG
jgi:hypothetical protein